MLNLTLWLLWGEITFKLIGILNWILKSELLNYVIFESWWWQLYQFDAYYIFHLVIMLGTILTFILYYKSFNRPSKIIVKPNNLEVWNNKEMTDSIPFDKINFVEIHKMRLFPILNLSRTRNKIILKNESEPLYFSLTNKRHYGPLIDIFNNQI